MAETLKKRTWAKDVWQEVGALSSVKNAASYRIQEFQEEIEGRTYRFVVVNSSKLDRRKEKTLRKQIDKERETLTKSLGELNKIAFVCRSDAENAWNTWRKKNAVERPLLCRNTVYEERRTVKSATSCAPINTIGVFPLSTPYAEKT